MAPSCTADRLRVGIRDRPYRRSIGRVNERGQGRRSQWGKTRATTNPETETAVAAGGHAVRRAGPWGGPDTVSGPLAPGRPVLVSGFQDTAVPPHAASTSRGVRRSGPTLDLQREMKRIAMTRIAMITML